MAIFHSSLQVISRGQGKSCVAAAAYRAGEKLYDERQEISHDYTKKHDVESEIIAPSNAPSWVYDREKLWNEVDRAETRCNSRTARELNIALPVELSKEQQKDLVREYVKENFVNKGMVADLCFHFNDENNPHFHVMLTTREIDQDGFTKKNRDWDKKENATLWREQWADHANKALERAGYEERIDHRSYKDQGIDQVPTIHLGKTSSEMQKKGIDNPRVEINNQIQELNKQKIIVLQEYRELKDKLEKEKAQRYSNLTADEKAIVQKVEKFIKRPLDYKTANESLDALSSIKNENLAKLSKIDFEVGVAERRLFSITHTQEWLKGAEKELKELPKNIFGQYKDKNRAEHLKADIQRYKTELNDIGYKGIVDVRITQRKIEELKNSIKELEDMNSAIYKNSGDIREGIKALQNKELREFYKEYKEQFPQDKYYFRYDEMMEIKKAAKLLGKPVSVQEMKSMYNDIGRRIEKIDDEMRVAGHEERQQLQSEMSKISPAFRTLRNVLEIIGNQQRNTQYQQHKDLKLTRAFKSKYQDEEMEL